MHILFFIKGVFLLLFLIGTSSAVLSRGVIFIHFLIILLIIFIYNIYNYIYLNPFTYFFYCLIVLFNTGLLVFTWTPSTSSSEFLPSWHLPTVAEENNWTVILSLLNCVKQLDQQIYTWANSWLKLMEELVLFTVLFL